MQSKSRHIQRQIQTQSRGYQEKEGRVTFFSERRCVECGDEFEVWGGTRRLTCGDQCQWHHRARLRKEAATRKVAAQ